MSAEEKARHELTHMPFRAWCPHCVRGRGRNRPHLKKKEKDGEVADNVPKIAMDYFFASEADQKAALNPILVMVDEKTGEKYARMVGKKGLGEGGEMEWLLKDMRDELVSWGHAGGAGGNIILKSDSEAAIVAVREALARRHGGIIVPERPPPGEKESNGVIEEAGRTVRCMAVTLKDALETKLKKKIHPGEAITEWIFRWAAMLCSRYLVGMDGRTAYERRRGRTCKVPVVSFGEVVHFKELHPDGRRDKMATDWHLGIWLGHTRESNEMLVGTEGGARRTYAVKRLPEEDRWDADRVKNMVGTPRQPDPARGGLHVPVQVRFEAEEPEEVPIDTNPSRREGVPKRVCIKDADLKKYGYTEGCVGCDSRLRGPPGRQNKARRNHDEVCRRRLEEAMKVDPQDKNRVIGAEERITDAIARNIEKEDQRAQEEKVEYRGEDVEGQAEDLRADGPREDLRADLRADGPREDLRADGPREEEEQRAGEVGTERMDVDRVEGKTPQTQKQSKKHKKGADNLKDDGEEENMEGKAKGHSKTPHRASGEVVHLMELFSEPRVAQWCSEHCLKAGISVDLKTGWDLHRRDHQELVLEYVRKNKPMMIVGSPPCTMFSALQNLTPWSAEREQRRRRDVALLRFAMKVYRLQVDEGRYFVHEHPATASSWREGAVKDLVKRQGVSMVVSDLCMFGLKTRG